MATFKVREIAEKLGVKAQTVNSWGRRKKLVIINGEIDDKNPINAAFLDEKLGVRQFEKTVNEEKKSETKTKKTLPTSDIPADIQFKLNLQSKKQDELKTAKLEEDLEIAKIKRRKMAGEVVPVDAVKKLFNTHFKNVSVEFYNAVDSYSTVMIKKVGGDRNDLAEIRVELKQIINDAVDKAKIKSKDDVDAIVKEFSDKKGRGESD